MLTFQYTQSFPRAALRERPLPEIPDFEKRVPDLAAIAEYAQTLLGYKNIILIGNGGSRTSAAALYGALADFRTGARFVFVDSADPDRVAQMRKNFSPDDTAVLAVSKSGNNINAIEVLLLFSEYPTAVITEEKEGNTLLEMARRKKWQVIPHPAVGGRFSAITSCALVPAVLMGLPLDEIYGGAKDGYDRWGFLAAPEANEALVLADALWELEQKGYAGIFAPVYSERLFGVFPLAVQLLHESSGKGGKGQILFGDRAPESQHHTNQRFFGGARNIVGMLWGVAASRNDEKISVPEDLRDVSFGDMTVGDLDGLSAARALDADRDGVFRHAEEENIPAVSITIDEITPRAIGECIVFWQYLAVYSAAVRGENPFDQPEVEASKKIGIALRRER